MLQTVCTTPTVCIMFKKPYSINIPIDMLQSICTSDCMSCFTLCCSFTLLSVYYVRSGIREMMAVCPRDWRC